MGPAVCPCSTESVRWTLPTPHLAPSITLPSLLLLYSSPGRLSGVLPPHLLHTYVLSPSQHATDMARRAIHALGAQRVLLFVRRTNQAMVTKYKLEARNMEVGERLCKVQVQEFLTRLLAVHVYSIKPGY